MDKPNANWLPPNEHYTRLAKKPSSAAVLFFNDKKELLIVKPNYRPDWLVPGGHIEAMEYPSEAAQREVLEEISLNTPNLKLLLAANQRSAILNTESSKYIFYGGELTDEQISSIKLQEEELTDFKLLAVEEALNLLSKSLKRLVPESLEALRAGTITYKEFQLD